LKKVDIAPGIQVVEIEEVGLRVLCGCLENSVKFMARSGCIRPMEARGVKYETGPNAVLLAEQPLRHGVLRNAAEFPILHMLYKQGMIVPGHPNNTGRRPLVIGTPRCVDELAEYVYLGNYGLTDPAELSGGGPDEAATREMLEIKRRFAFGTFKRAEDLLELRRLDSPVVELRDGLFLRRLAADRYEFSYKDETVAVDLSGSDAKRAGAPYPLPRSTPGRQTFAVTHTGEGDGWDPTRPCMGSLVSAGGGLWLIDAGPNIDCTLKALGLAASDLAGVFNTHVHDDHFIGLASLYRARRKRPLIYCAIPWVRRAAVRKLAAVARIPEADFRRKFEVRDLEADRWNDFGGFSVMPVVAPHPVENTMFKFRVTGPEGERTYAHWADLTSFAVLEKVARAGDGVPADAIDRIKELYLERADLKKLDVGGGMIHGDARDFADDRSADLIVSHTSSPKMAASMPVGRVASFGEVSVLIDSHPRSRRPRQGGA